MGGEVARRARGLGMVVTAYDPYASVEKAKAQGVELVSFDKAIANSDFFSLHMPMTPGGWVGDGWWSWESRSIGGFLWSVWLTRPYAMHAHVRLCRWCRVFRSMIASKLKTAAASNMQVHGQLQK